MKVVRRHAENFRWIVLCLLALFASAVLPTHSMGLSISTGANSQFFNQSVDLTTGDISFFFEPGLTNVPLPGVCVGNDAAPALPGLLGTEGLGESPTSGGGTLDGELHPSGFNQRRVITGFNPSVGGGTLFVGVDLPGGSGSPSNPVFSNDFGGVVARGQVLPFDADGNGEADFIGRTVDADPATRYSACPAPSGTPDVWTCLSESAGALDNPRLGALGEQEFYSLSVVFGGGQRVAAVFGQFNNTPANMATVTVATVLIPVSSVGVRVSTDTGGSGVPQGFDVIFAVTNLNSAITNECERWDQSVLVRSGSNSDGSGQGEDINAVRCIYLPPGEVNLVAACPPSPSLAGGPVQLVVTVNNPGPVTLTNLTLTNSVVGVSTGQVAEIMSLAPGASTNVQVTYVVPVDYGSCLTTNILTAVGYNLCTGDPVSSITTNVINSVEITLICTTNPTLPGGVSSSLPAVPPIVDQMASPTPICATYEANHPISFSKVTLSQVPSGYCVTNGTYLSWCVDYAGILSPWVVYKPLFYLATRPLPASLQNPNWDKVNYIINHKQGTGVDVQIAIWHFIGGPVPPWDPTYGVITPAAQALIDDANLNGSGFVPTGTEVTAVILDLGATAQLNIIEVICPSGWVFCQNTDNFICALTSGGGPFTYTWSKDGATLAAETNSCLMLTNVTVIDAGLYCVEVASPCGTSTACAQVSVMVCSAPAIMAAFASMGGSTFEIRVEGDLGGSFTVQASLDLMTWREVTTLVNTSGILRFEDPLATDKVFYRLMMVQ